MNTKGFVARSIDTTEAAFTSAMRNVVLPDPGRVADVGACCYEKDGAPSCLIGQVLYLLGVPVWALAQLDTRDESSADYVLAWLGFPEEVVDAARAAQELQDDGLAWGLALETYITELGKGAWR